MQKNTVSRAMAHHNHMKASNSVWKTNYIPVITAIWIKKSSSFNYIRTSKGLSIMKILFFHSFFLITSLVMSSCFPDRSCDEEELTQILYTALPFEMERLIAEKGAQKLNLKFPSDSNLIYLTSGLTSQFQKETLQLVLNPLNEPFYELNVSFEKYHQIADSLCAKNKIGFTIPENAKELNNKFRQGGSFASIEMHRVWINEDRNRCVYFSKSGFVMQHDFYPGAYSAVFFKKKKKKWVLDVVKEAG